MAVNNNLSVIPFYQNIEEQDFRKPWSYGNVFHLYVGKSYFLPFFFVLPHTANQSFHGVELYKKTCTGFTYVTDLVNEFEDSGLYVYQSGNYDICGYKNNGTSLGYNFEQGEYYLKIIMEDVAETTLYSDIFTIVPDNFLSKLIKIEWSSYNDISYDGGVWLRDNKNKGILYLDTEIGMPEYPFEEEGESRNGYFFPTKQISYKKYKFLSYAPEYLCDAMRMIRMMDTIKVTDTLGRVYNVNSFTLNDPEWLETGHYAKIECEFTTDTVVKVVGRSNN